MTKGVDLKDYYFPGHIHISNELREKFHFRTISDPTTNLNEIYYFVQVYERAEELIKTRATDIYLQQWEKMLTDCQSLSQEIEAGKVSTTENDIRYIGKLMGRLKNAIHKGPTVSDINEVLADVRRASYTEKEKMNPPGHVPFLNALVNLRTRKKENFSPDFFYTWQIQANYLDKRVTLLDTPRFRYYLESVYNAIDIPLILSYGGYSLQPEFPRNKILIIVGRERMGKGVWARILKRLNPKGYGTISFEKLLIADNRFAFQNVLGKNLLVDPEMKRKFTKGVDPDFANINKLFGGDTIDVERKGKDVLDSVNKAKGIMIGNLPIFYADNPALIARSSIVRTKDKRESPEVPNLDGDIFENEKDEIATLLMECHWGLQDRNYVFPGEMDNSGGRVETYDSETKAKVTRTLLGTLEYWELLADPITLFIESETFPEEQSEIPVDDVYAVFDKWCTDQGIPTPAKQTFTGRFGETYTKRYRGPRSDRRYFFTGVQLVSTLKVDPQNKLNTGGDSQKPKYIGALWNKFKRVQLRSYSQNYYLSCAGENVIKEHVPKLNTGVIGDKIPNSVESGDTQAGVQPFLDINDFRSFETYLRENNYTYAVENDKIGIKTPAVESRRYSLAEIAKGYHFEPTSGGESGEIIFRHERGTENEP